MMRMKRIAAALLAVVMTLTLMSGIVINASATAVNELGGPATIEVVQTGSDNGSGGITVPGVKLDNDILVVSKSWEGQTGRVAIKLNGVVYQATIGVDAFGELADALAKARNNSTIYVAAGTYSKAATINAASLNIYGPYAGVNPNDPTDISKPNPVRPGADGENMDDEAVITATITVNAQASNLTVDGMAFRGAGYLNDVLSGGFIRAGTYLRNNVLNITANYFLNTGAGSSPGLDIENNRAVACKSIINIGGMVGMNIRNNYINNSAYVVVMTSVTDGSMGQYCLLEGNYFPYTNGLIHVYSGHQTLYYSLQLKNNTVMEGGSNPLILNNYYDLRTVGGTNVIVEGNTFKNLRSAPFQFPRNKDNGTTVPFTYPVRMTENYFELPAGVNFIESTSEANYQLPNMILDLSKNYCNTGLTADRILKSEDSKLFLYPYYSDPEMKTLVGAGKIVGVADALKDVTTINQDEKTILIDLKGKGIDQLALEGQLLAEEGCDWKLFADATLGTELEDKMIYFDGESTVRYVAVEGLDGALSKEPYALKLLNDRGTKAEILDIVTDVVVPAPVISGQTYTFNLDKNTAFLNYELKVSPGAKVELVNAEGNPIEDLNGYIPHSGYTVYAKVTSQGTDASPAYTITYPIVFNREKSDYYDPSILAGVLPEGNLVVNPRRKVINYYCENLLGEETFDFKTTPGAIYKIFTEDEKKELSSSTDIRAIPLKSGTNVFKVWAAAGADVNVFTMYVMNGELSDDTKIMSLTGSSGSIVNNDITAIASGTTVSLTFNTRNAYATCKVYADKEKKIEVAYTSAPQQVEGSIHVIDRRSFNLASEYAMNYYYVVCTAENGKTEDYTLTITKNIAAKEYSDVKESDWYASYVNDATLKGYIAGSVQGEIYSFNANDKMTREQLGIIMSRVIGYNAAAYAKVEVPFADIAKISKWAVDYAKVCYHNGIIKGSLGAGGKVYYNPKAAVTRQEVMVIFARTLKLSGSYNLASFKDGKKVASWAQAEVQAVVASGLIQGDEKGYLKPTASMTRAEIAAVLSRM